MTTFHIGSKLAISITADTTLDYRIIEFVTSAIGAKRSFMKGGRTVVNDGLWILMTNDERRMLLWSPDSWFRVATIGTRAAQVSS
jgi:hypothetical protein